MNIDFFKKVKKAITYDILDFCDPQLVFHKVKRIRYKKIFEYYLHLKKTLKEEYINHTNEFFLNQEQENKMFKYLNQLKINNCQMTTQGIEYLGKCYTSFFYLDLSSNFLADKGMENVLKYIRFEALKFLKLSQNFFSDRGIASFKDKVFKELVHLDLSMNRIREQGIYTLATEVSLPKLNVLDLSQNTFEDIGVVNLCVNESFTNLEKLYLSSVSMTEKGLVSILQNPVWKLKKLLVQRNQIDTRNLTIPTLLKQTNLIELDIYENKCVTFNLITFFLSNGLRNIETLTLCFNSNGISYEKFEKEKEAPLTLPTLSHLYLPFNPSKYVDPRLFFNMSDRFITLDLYANHLEDSFVKIMTSREIGLRFTSLEFLGLCKNNLTSESVRLLATSTYLTKIKKIDLSFNFLLDSEEYFASNAVWPFLEELYLEGSRITNPDILLRNTSWKSLQSLIIKTVSYSSNFKFELQKVWPNVRLLDGIGIEQHS